MQLITNDGRDFDTLRKEFSWQIPESFNIADWVCDRHDDIYDKAAIYYQNPAGEEIVYSFGELYKQANRFANALRGLGVERGDRVAIILPQRPETAIAHIASYKLGAITVPLAVLFGPEAIEYRLRNSGAKVVITDQAHAETILALKAELPHLKIVVQCDGEGDGVHLHQLLERSSDAFKTVETAAEDPALLIYTSGTTGQPKGALIAHRSLLGNLPGFELSQNFFPAEEDVFWTPADWAWTGGLMDGLLPSLAYGRPILASPVGKFDPEQALALCSKYKVSNAFIPPTALKLLRQVENIGEKFELRFRGIMSAGERVGPELIDWGKQTLGLDINEMWGQTEFNYLVGNSASILPIKPGSIGKPYPGHFVEPIDEDGNPVADGETGELAAKAGDPVAFLGYWQDQEATDEKYSNDWFRTGDLGYRDEDGYLWFLGRKDDVISSSGYRIGPGEIEDSLIKHPAVAQAAVIGKLDELRGEIVKAFVVLRENFGPSEALAKEIQDSVKERLSAHEYPREVEFIDELPTTTTGKIRRVELREKETPLPD